MKKKIGYWVFAFLFRLFRICPLNPDKVFFVATHDDGSEGNAGITAREIKRVMPEKRIFFLTKRDGPSHPLRFFVVFPFHMATSGTIFMDNHFMPMAYMSFSKKVKVVQLWHGTGTIKKFGLDAENGEVARLAKKANRCITHLIVSSKITAKQYETAFGVPADRIHIIGLPRTDVMLDEEKLEKKRDMFFEEFPDLRSRRIILYAPTFRDEETGNPRVALDLKEMADRLDQEDVLLLRLHPHVADKLDFSDEKKYRGKIRNFSGYTGGATLLAVADCLITDYSSIIFEYCLQEKPMVFYAYDLDAFEKTGRGFYEKYESFVPGPVVRTQEELLTVLNERGNDVSRIRRFNGEHFFYRDKKSVCRLLELIFEKDYSIIT